MDKQIIIESEPLEKDLLNYVIKYRNKYYVHHFLCNSPYHNVDINNPSLNNTSVNKMYRGNLQLYNEMIKKSSYEDMSIIIEKKFQLEWFHLKHKIIYEKLGEKDYYKLLGNILGLQEFHYYSKQFYPTLLYYGKDPLLMMSDSERETYDNLPDELIVYRGLSNKKPINKKKLEIFVGNSWTLNKNISIKFSKELLLHSEKNGYYYILSYSVKKSEILSYFNQRNEEEIFLDHTKIDINKIEVEQID